jgi:multidrug resistance efflux pump
MTLKENVQHLEGALADAMANLKRVERELHHARSADQMTKMALTQRDETIKRLEEELRQARDLNRRLVGVVENLSVRE